MRVAIRFVGNDGTFATKGSLHPLDEPVDLRFNIDPGTPGIHSAILEIDAPDTNGVDLVAQYVVFAPEQFTANGNQATKSGAVARNDTRHLLVRVPEGATALRVDLDGGGADAGAGQIRFLRFTPQGLGLEPASSVTCSIPNAGGDPGAGRTLVGGVRVVDDDNTTLGQRTIRLTPQMDAATVPAMRRRRRPR